MIDLSVLEAVVWGIDDPTNKTIVLYDKKRCMAFSFVIFVFVFVFDFVFFCFFVLFLFCFFSFLFKMCTVGLYVSLCLMIFLCPFLHCKALRTAMYKRYINSIIIIIIIFIII